MNDNEKVVTLITKIEEIEKENHRDRYESDKLYRNNVVNAILEELEKVMADENK